MTEDGTRILSIRIHAAPRPFDERHTVIAPDGGSRVFETSGPTQTIRDGATDAVLARSTVTRLGAVPEPEAVVQPVFLPAVPATVATTIELGGRADADPLLAAVAIPAGAWALTRPKKITPATAAPPPRPACRPRRRSG